MNSKLLIAAGVLSIFGAMEAIHSPVAEAQLVQPGFCQSAFGFETNNDLGDCLPALSITTNPIPSMQDYARRADLELARSEDRYNSAFAANYTQWVANNGMNSSQVAASSIQCSGNDNGPAKLLCEPGIQTAASQKTRYNRIGQR
jgi:hypothetical protein